MKKSFSYYLICWGVMVVLFNIICFVTPSSVMGESKFTGAFWTGYAFIMATFIAHCAFNGFALSAKTKERQILNIPLVIISIIELIIMIIAGSVFMAIPALPYWLGIVVCSVILGISIIVLATAKGVGEAVSEANVRLNQKTDNYRKMVDSADILVKRAQTSEEKELAQKVYDAVRYSDAVSDETIAPYDTAILNGINALTVNFLNKAPFETSQKQANELFILIEQRGNACKASKRAKQI